MKKVALINTIALDLSIIQLSFQLLIGSAGVAALVPFPDDLGLQEEFRIIFDQHPFLNDFGLFVHNLILVLLMLAFVVVFLNIIMVAKNNTNKKLISILLLIPPYLFITYSILLFTFSAILHSYTEPNIPVEISVYILGATLFSIVYLLNLIISVVVVLAQHKIIFKAANLDKDTSIAQSSKSDKPWIIMITVWIVFSIVYILFL